LLARCPCNSVEQKEKEDARHVRRNDLFDVIVIIVTLVTFLLLISFTIGCERL
jgi:hypothetical protein